MSIGFMAAFATFIGCFVAVPLVLGIGQFLNFYTIVEERQCRVVVLFGKVIGTIEEPGLHFLWLKFGPSALLVPWFGSVKVVDMRLDQQYLRNQAVNSEEGAPMGIGIWYEMFVSDPVAYLFKNTDPRGALLGNVSSTTVRCLSNMPLHEMLESRHRMSQTVRSEVSPKSNEWGYKLGSVYIRKVHFRDAGMIKQIEEKVVNRLRQVTSAIKQDGSNQVNIIRSSADRQAAVAFAQAAAIRPSVVGKALREVSSDPEIAEGLFEVLEVQKLTEGSAGLFLVPPDSGIIWSRLLTGPEPTDHKPAWGEPSRIIPPGTKQAPS